MLYALPCVKIVDFIWVSIIKKHLNVSGFEPPTSIHCTCPARAICPWCQLFIRQCDAPADMHKRAEFGVASSKTHKTGGSYVFKVPLVWHVHLAPLGIGDSKSTYQLLMATCLPSLVHVRQLGWPAGSSDSLMYCIGHKYLHVHCTCSMHSK